MAKLDWEAAFKIAATLKGGEDAVLDRIEEMLASLGAATEAEVSAINERKTETLELMAGIAAAVMHSAGGCGDVKHRVQSVMLSHKLVEMALLIGYRDGIRSREEVGPWKN